MFLITLFILNKKLLRSNNESSHLSFFAFYTSYNFEKPMLIGKRNAYPGSSFYLYFFVPCR